MHESKTQTIQRLCIDKLILNNFKSYAGVQEIGPFHTSFSAVVGPNGSGKSNVIDSMLFVFGFRANKMRQGKLSELIHKSEQFPDLPSCSVQIHFQYVQDMENGETKILHSSGKLVVERRAFKNNSSKYYVNGKENNYTEVTRLLKDEGIDLDHKRFLILQGEVESIAQMKPKADKDGDDGLLEYLEDIIGTADFKPQIERCLNEIETLNDICLEKENRFELVDKEKQSLESGKAEALEFLEKEKKHTEIKSKLLQHKIWYNDKKLASTIKKINSLNEEFKQEKEVHANLQEKATNLSSNLEDIRAQIHKLDAKYKESHSKKRALEKEYISIEEKLKSVNRKLKAAEKAFQQSESDAKHATNELEQLYKKNEEYQIELTELFQTLDAEKEKLRKIKLELHEKTKDLSQEIELIEKQLEPYNNQIRDKQSEIKLSEAKISMLMSTHNNLKSERDRILKTIDDLKADDEKTIENLETNARQRHERPPSSCERDAHDDT